MSENSKWKREVQNAYFAYDLGSWCPRTFMPYSMGTSTSTIWNMVIPFLVLFVIQWPFKEGKSFVNRLFNKRKIFLLTKVFIYQVWSFFIKYLIFGARKNRCGKELVRTCECIINVFYVWWLQNVTVHSWAMMFQSIVVNIKQKNKTYNILKNIKIR
jgi:hypothetical protein